MNSDYQLPSAVVTPYTYPYQSQYSSSASSSSSSVFSVDASSQSSESSNSTSANSLGSDNTAWESDHCTVSRCKDGATASHTRNLPPLKTCEAPVVASHQRVHPRRTSASGQKPPALVRQSERKGQFVECLVDSATHMVEVIWPLSVPHCPNESGRSGVLPLRTFIQETLRRSRTSFSTLQVALYYLILIKAYVPRCDFTMEQLEDSSSSRALQCGRRMFLAALILASKYLQDRNYSARAWSRISGLKTEEINTNEMAFLKAVNWKLHVPEALFDKWQEILIKYTAQMPPTPDSASASTSYNWRSLIPRLTPALDTLNVVTCNLLNIVVPEARKAYASPPRFLDNDSTPSPSSPAASVLPRFLEPSPSMLPPTPTLARMGPLPTPILTPKSAVSNTPAVSFAGFGAQRSMCSAMNQAQNACMARSVMDYNWPSKMPASGLEAYQLSARRPSLHSISGSSLTSSPESMISDSASHSSHASSISSVSSLSSANAWAPSSIKLNRLATMRCAGLPCPLPSVSQSLSQKEPETAYLRSYSTEPISPSVVDLPAISDLESITMLPIRQRELQGQCSPNKGRKRGRSSVDMSLRQNVQEFLGTNARSFLADTATCVLPDQAIAHPSVFLRSPCPSMPTPTADYVVKALQSPVRSIPERRLPIQKDLGRKRACASEASFTSFSGGPGMWEGIL